MRRHCEEDPEAQDCRLDETIFEYCIRERSDNNHEIVRRPLAGQASEVDETTAEVQEADQGSAPSDAEIDYYFIGAIEGASNEMHRPDSEASGPTIGSGYDLGARQDRSELERELPDVDSDVIDLLEPYLGLQGSDADEYVNTHPLELPSTVIAQINANTYERELEQLIERFEQHRPFTELPQRGKRCSCRCIIKLRGISLGMTCGSKSRAPIMKDSSRRTRSFRTAAGRPTTDADTKRRFRPSTVTFSRRAPGT